MVGGLHLTAPFFIKLPVYKVSKHKSYPKMIAVLIFFKISTSGLSAESLVNRWM